jgi:uncharacterized membrane protein YcjF (UPF0283 family)
MIARAWKAILAAAPVKIWAQIGAAMSLTLVFAGFGLVIWLGPWAPALQGKQIDWLGYGMMAAALLVLVALAAITGLNVDLHGSKDGVHARIDQDEAQPMKVETTVATTVTPAQPATSNDGELPASERLQP